MLFRDIRDHLWDSSDQNPFNHGWTRMHTDKNRFANAAKLDMTTTSLKVQGL
jgi:hypothetical protein